MREGIEDVVFCFLRFPSGLAAHLHLSWLDPHKERRFTVVGENRMATFDDMALEGKITVYDKGFDEQAGRGSYGEYITRSGDIWSPRLPNVEPLRTEIEHFVQSIRTGTTPISDGESGLRVVRVLEAPAALARRHAPQRRLALGRPQHVIDARTLKVRAYKALQAGAGRVGLQVVPKNYYSPIPDLDALPAGAFDRRSALRGIHFDLDEQVAWIERHLADAMREFDPAPEVVDNASYGRVGADLLHGIVRALKPRRIVELGSGHSTLVHGRGGRAQPHRRRRDRAANVRPVPDGRASAGPARARGAWRRCARRTCRWTSSPRSRPATCCSWTPRTRSSSTRT